MEPNTSCNALKLENIKLEEEFSVKNLSWGRFASSITFSAATIAAIGYYIKNWWSSKNNNHFYACSYLQYFRERAEYYEDSLVEKKQKGLHLLGKNKHVTNLLQI